MGFDVPTYDGVVVMHTYVVRRAWDSVTGISETTIRRLGKLATE